jgi:uncharacterized membrane protein YukC
MESDSTKLNTQKLQQKPQINAATIQKKSFGTQDIVIAIMLVLLVIVIGIIVYLQFFR